MTDPTTEDAVFMPPDVMLDLVESAVDWLWSDEATAAGRSGATMWRPDLWEAMAGFPQGTFQRWKDQHGEPFLDWFTDAIQPTKGQIAAMRVQYWRTMGRLSISTSSNASQLKLLGDLLGLNKERPEPPPVPYMDEQAAWAFLMTLGPEVLDHAKSMAEDREAQRRDPNWEPPETNPEDLTDDTV